MSVIRLPSGYEVDLGKVPTLQDVLAINAQVGWIPQTDDEMALQAWARSLNLEIGFNAESSSARMPPPPMKDEPPRTS